MVPVSTPKAAAAVFTLCVDAGRARRCPSNTGSYITAPTRHVAPIQSVLTPGDLADALIWPRMADDGEDRAEDGMFSLLPGVSVAAWKMPLRARNIKDATIKLHGRQTLVFHGTCSGMVLMQPTFDGVATADLPGAGNHIFLSAMSCVLRNCGHVQIRR